MLAKHRFRMPWASRILSLPFWGGLFAHNAVAQEPPQQPTIPTNTAVDDNLFSTSFFVELGFSFVVGVAIGYALKIAFKIALIVGGVALLSVFALQYAGVADINWSGIEVKYDGLTTWLMASGGAFKGFISDRLSSAASFTAGLLVGLKL